MMASSFRTVAMRGVPSRIRRVAARAPFRPIPEHCARARCSPASAFVHVADLRDDRAYTDAATRSDARWSI